MDERSSVLVSRLLEQALSSRIYGWIEGGHGQAALVGQLAEFGKVDSRPNDYLNRIVH